jgi:3-oxoacyl-[acyl-carrier-protein] synthase III
MFKTLHGRVAYDISDPYFFPTGQRSDRREQQMKASITGIGHYTPEKRLTNLELEKIVDTNDEWIKSRTGIKERRILDKNLGTSHMAAKAAKAVLKNANVSPDELDLIILATVTPDMMFPSTAALVQKEIAAGSCWGFDLSAGCSGFVYAVATGAQFIESGRHKKVMVIGADKMSAIVNYEDRNTCVLFGDGAGAVLLEPSRDDEFGITDFSLHIDGEGADSLYMPAGGSLMPASHETVNNKLHFLCQDGKTVFKQAVTRMADVSASLLERNRLNKEEIRAFIPHQANLRIIDAVAKRLDLEPDQVVINIEKYGNTTAATIPLAMAEAYENKMFRPGDWVVMAAFGAGYTSGSLLFKWAIE